MYASFINLLREDINAFISQKKGANGVFINFANLNNITENTQSADNKVIASIVNIEEEKTLKSPENYVKLNNGITYKQPPIWLNIVVVFTYFTRSAENYEGIDLLGNVMQYFQSKPKLTKTNVLIPANFPANLEELRTEYLSLNYEQTNYIWGMFGGRYHPSVVYKFKAISIDNQDSTPGGPPILDVEVSAVHK
jgi:hypothetical protein